MARKFRFRLETVERLRRQARDRQRHVVANHVQAATTVRQRIESLLRSKLAIDQDTRTVLGGGVIDAESLRRNQWHRQWLERTIQGAERDRETKQAELDRQLSRLSELSRELKAIEKLRERRLAQHRVEVAREEQAEHDEAAIGRYGRHPRALREPVPA